MTQTPKVTAVMKSRLIVNITYCFLSSIFVFILIPIVIIGNSPKDYQFLDVLVFFKSGVLFSILLGLIFSIVYLIFHLFRLNQISNIFPLFVFLWVFITGFISPVSISMGMVDPGFAAVDKINFVVSFAIVGLLCVIAFKIGPKPIFIIVSVVAITTTASALYSIYDSGILQKENIASFALSNKMSLDPFALSNKKNILVVSFDGMPGSIMTEIIKNDKKRAKDLKDFIVFSNAVSQSPATSASLMGEIYGVLDYKSKGKKISDVLKAFANEGLNEKLLHKRVEDSYDYGYGGFGKPMKINSLPPDLRKIETFDFFRYPIVRVGTRFALLALHWGKSTQYLQLFQTSNLDFYNKIRNSYGERWDRKNQGRLRDFETFIDNIRISDKTFSVRYMHFLFTHYPVNFDENCNYRSDDYNWHFTNQNKSGIQKELNCVLNLFSRFLEKLKKIGLYDNSLIVLKSDHGKPLTYFSNPPDNLSINETEKWGYNRYRPTLMIKDFAANKSNVTYKSELVLINDLANTLCRKSGLNMQCNQTPGVDLLSDSLKSEEPYYLYVVKNRKHDDFRFDAQVSVKIPSRNLSLFEAMKEAGLFNIKSAQ
jgi:hypothetical protein